MRYYLILVILLIVPYLKAQSSYDQDIQSKYNKIIAAHKTIYSLPYDYDFKKNTIMAEVIAERLIVAPHFPQRENTGEDQVTIREAFFDWIAQYPNEYSLYLNRTHEITRKYQ